MQEWEQNARDAHIDKMTSQLKNQKLMLGGLQSIMPNGLPQLMEEDTPVNYRKSKQIGSVSQNDYSPANDSSNRGANRN